jgi:choline dehydrogenase
VRFRSDPSTLNGGWIADKVDYGQNASSVRKTVGVRKEVILCGGAVGTPAILMHSGFGSRSVLESAGIEVLEELEGVGEHLQDHLVRCEPLPHRG